MPKPQGFTQKGKLKHWLRQNPGIYTTKKLARQHKCSRAVVLICLHELEANGNARQRGKGRSTRWVVKRGVKGNQWHAYSQSTSSTKKRQCDECGGTGTVIITSSPGLPEHGSIEQESCPKCNGEGEQ